MIQYLIIIVISNSCYVHKALDEFSTSWKLLRLCSVHTEARSLTATKNLDVPNCHWTFLVNCAKILNDPVSTKFSGQVFHPPLEKFVRYCVNGSFLKMFNRLPTWTETEFALPSHSSFMLRVTSCNSQILCETTKTIKTIKTMTEL